MSLQSDENIERPITSRREYLLSENQQNKNTPISSDHHQTTAPNVTVIHTSEYFKTAIRMQSPSIISGNETATVDIGQIDDIDNTANRFNVFIPYFKYVQGIVFIP